MRLNELVNPIHRSDELHRCAGTFYHATYEDADRIRKLFDSYCWSYQLLLDEALDASKLFVRTLIPPVHHKKFFPIQVHEQEYRDGKKQLLIYGTDDVRYGDDYYFGHPAALVTGAVELPQSIVDIEICCDQPIDPNVILFKGEHFFIRNGHIYFTTDLFEAVPVREEAGRDRSVILYLRGVTIDRHYVQSRLGKLLQTQGPSTQAFADFNNLVMDSVMAGTGTTRLMQLLCRLFDVPCTLQTETVEQIGVTLAGRWLATDRTVYFVPHAAAFRVQPGERLLPGTILTDAILSVSKTVPNDLPILLEKRFLGPTFESGLLFPNKEEPIRIDKGFPYPTFTILGRFVDIRRFWDMFYSHLENRDILSRSAEGGRINPARWVYEQFLYPRAFFFHIDPGKCGLEKLPVLNTKVFRSLLPPGLLFSILLTSPNKSFALGPIELASSPPKLYSAATPVACPIRLSAILYPIRSC